MGQDPFHICLVWDSRAGKELERIFVLRLLRLLKGCVGLSLMSFPSNNTLDQNYQFSSECILPQEEILAFSKSLQM